jgi:hypothetical protein
VQLEGLKNPITSGLEPAIFWLVALCPLKKVKENLKSNNPEIK